MVDVLFSVRMKSRSSGYRLARSERYCKLGVTCRQLESELASCESARRMLRGTPNYRGANFRDLKPKRDMLRLAIEERAHLGSIIRISHIEDYIPLKWTGDCYRRGWTRRAHTHPTVNVLFSAFCLAYHVLVEAGLAPFVDPELWEEMMGCVPVVVAMGRHCMLLPTVREPSVYVCI